MIRIDRVLTDEQKIQPILSVTVLNAHKQEVSVIWKVIKITTSEIRFKLDFDDVEAVSETPDSLYEL